MSSLKENKLGTLPIGRLLLTMENGEQVYVSRQYAASIKEKLRELERSLTR